MEASKLTISPEHIRFKTLTPAKRAELRRENIKALVRSKPAGTIIMLPEFAMVTAGKPGTVHAMLKTMLKKGVITRQTDDNFKARFSYTVNEDVKVKKPRAEPVAKKQDTSEIVEKAKEFVWEQNSDSLRDFIKWLKEE